MGLNSTPNAGRVHIGIFGKINAGKSSVINAITNQNLAIVSAVKGTTTDPVYKAMELLPLGPVVLIDTPGLDDQGELGSQRMAKSYQVLNKTDIAVLVTDAETGLTGEDKALVQRFKEKSIPYLIVVNKADLAKGERIDCPDTIWVSAKNGDNIWELKERIAKIAPVEGEHPQIVADLIAPLDFLVLVVPIDSAAPKGRLILPQQQTIREILEVGATAIVVREFELKDTLANLAKKPKMVITDSQAFAKVFADTPKDILLTSFSILFARHKGKLEQAVQGVRAVDALVDGDGVLIAEGCTHHRQCDDIGTVKIPRWLKEYTGKNLKLSYCSGTAFPDDLSPYKLVIHCGGCTLNEREMKYRLQCAGDQGTPITNYGIFIAHTQGILKRSLEPFPHILATLKNE